jgi:hypothetical protein
MWGKLVSQGNVGQTMGAVNSQSLLQAGRTKLADGNPASAFYCHVSIGERT